MIFNIVTQTHNRRQIFLENFKYNFSKIKSYIKDLNIQINWIINSDDNSIVKNDIENFYDEKINLYFYEKTNFFPKRYFELMLIKKADFIWCLEDDDLILSNFFQNINNFDYNYVFYYFSDYEKINNHVNYCLKNKLINFETWQLGQMIMRYKDIKKFFYLKKRTNFFKNRDFIEYDEDIIWYLLKNSKIKIIPQKIFIQKINGDNMSIEDLNKWR